jgi:hypothetical protein
MVILGQILTHSIGWNKSKLYDLLLLPYTLKAVTIRAEVTMDPKPKLEQLKSRSFRAAAIVDCWY